MGNPIPAEARVEIPPAIMIRGPTPRFVAHPVPSGIRALPMSVAIRTPIRLHAGRNPAAPIRADVFPMPIRAQRLVKIARLADDHLDRRRLNISRLRRGRRGRDDRTLINIRCAASKAGNQGHRHRAKDSS